MKDITIGTKQYKLMTTMFDINEQRFLVFKQHLLQTFESMDKPSFLLTYAKVVSLYDKGQHADAIIELHNFKKSQDLKELNYDAYSICFALLIKTEGENMIEVDMSEQLAKLKELREAGLDRGIVEETVVNFMKASPKAFGAYLKVLEMMTAPLSEELLNVLSNEKDN